MNKKYGMQFFEEPDDAGGGPSAIDLLDGPDKVEKDEPTDGAPDVPSPKAPAIDYAALAAANAEAFKAAGLTPKAEAPKPLTPEEAKKLLNVWEPSDEFLTKFDNIDTKKAAMAEMRDALIKQADTIVQLRLKELNDEYAAKFEPMTRFVTEQEANAREARFHKANPDLAKPELAPILGAVIQDLGSKGLFKDKKEAEVFKLIADTVEGVIKVSNPNFKLSPGGSNPAGKTQQHSGLRPTTSGAGGGGGGKATGAATGKPLAIQLLS